MGENYSLHNVKYLIAKVQIENARSQSYHKKIGFIETHRNKEYIYYKMDVRMVNEINRDGFVVNQFRFKDFTTLSIEEKKMVLDWRNTESIRKWMYNKEEIDLESHIKFIDSLRDRDDRYYWLVTDLNNEHLGVVNVTSVDRDNDRAELGLYLNPDTSMMGFYFVRECYYFFFCVLNIGKLYCSVDKDNKSAMLLDEFFGCRFTEKKIIDNGTQKDEYLVSTNLTRNQFEKNYSLTFKDYILFVRNKQKENN